jgi:glutathione S-transferase
MKVFGTYPSHFTRKVRIVLQELGISYEFLPLKNLMATGPEHFANNPLHQLPTIIAGDKTLIDSDLICEYLIEKYGNGRLCVYPEGDIVAHKQRLAIINGGMDAGVKIIRAQRNEIPLTYPFFQQEKASLVASLDWLEKDLGSNNFYGSKEILSLLELNLFCFLEWAVFRAMIPSLEIYPNLQRFEKFHKNRASFQKTHPSISEGI